MGNKISKQKKKRKESDIFFSPTSSLMSASVTVPSKCTSPSFHMSLKRSTTSSESEAFTWSQMQLLYMQHENLTVDNFTIPMLKTTSTVFEVLKKYLGSICAGFDSGLVKLPEPLMDRFGYSGLRTTSAATQSTMHFNVGDMAKRLTAHLIGLLYVHDMVLNNFRQKKFDLALDIIKQVAIGHALGGVTPNDFRMMDWFILNYMIKNKVTSDESINCLGAYLNTFTNYITKFYGTQSFRHNVVEGTNEKCYGREGKARENFRLMKKWQQTVQLFRGNKDHVAELLLEEQIQLRQTEEDTRSVDTIELKQKDFIMKHFTKRKNDFQLTRRPTIRSTSTTLSQPSKNS